MLPALMRGLTYMEINMQKFVIPRPGLIVRDPVQFNPLPAEGGFIDWNGNSGRYWRRRVSCGDVSIVDAPIPVKTTSTKKKE